MGRQRCILALLLASLQVALSQGIIRTVAGTDWNFPAGGGPALDAPLGRIERLALGPGGSLYIADPDNNMVFRADPNGALAIVAGNGEADFYGDNGPATAAALAQPSGVAVDAAGNLYIADSANERIRKVSGGVISTIAGTGSYGYNGDNTAATLAQLAAPSDVAVDTAGNVYIADAGNNRVRKVDAATGVITTIAGTGERGFSGDGGPATAAQVESPVGLFLDANGRLYIALSRRVRRIAGGVIETIAGIDDYLEPQDGQPALQASLGDPQDLAVDAAGVVYLADSRHSRVRRIVPGGAITTVAGTGEEAFAGDGGAATAAALNGIRGVAVDAQGNLFIADTLNSRLRKVSAADGRIATIAGNNAFKFGGDGGPAAAGLLHQPAGVARAPNGDFYIADSLNHRVRRISANGVLSTLAGNGNGGFSGDGGPAAGATLNQPIGVALDSAGNLYVADTGNQRVRRIDGATGVITTFAGGGNGEAPGPATQVRLNDPAYLAFDVHGNLYITQPFRVLRVTPGGQLTAFAFDGEPQSRGDGGPAAAASILYAGGIAVDAAGNVYVTELYRGTVRRITPDGLVDRFAGVPQADCCSGDGGPALSAAIGTTSLALDAAGALYIGGGSRVRKITPGGIVSTVAGGGFPPAGSLGDGGSALEASLRDVAGLLVEPGGVLTLTDGGHDRVRQVFAEQPPFDVAPRLLTFTAQSAGPPAVSKTLQVSSLLTNLAYHVTANTDSGSWLQAFPEAGSVPGILQVTADPAQLPPGDYEGTVSIRSDNASPPLIVVTVKFSVTPADKPALSIGPGSLLFDYVLTQPPYSDSIDIRNIGSGAIPFTLQATTTTGGDWLRIDAASGSVTSTRPATVVVTASPANLGEGTYSGLITAASADLNQRVLIPVTMVVHASTKTIVLSQNGITFRAAQGSVAPLLDFFAVLNTGLDTMNWTAAVQTTSGGTWLSATPATGASGPGGTSPGFVNVRASPAGLATGDYYGSITIAAPDAANSPQQVAVVLRVTAAADTAPDVRPTGLLFTGVRGAPVAPQEVIVTNLAAAAATFRSTGTADSGPSFFSYQPSAGVLPSAQPARITVQPDLNGLTPGVRRGRITLEFASGATRVVEVVLVIPDVATPAPSPPAMRFRNLAGCTPAGLNLVFSRLGQQFRTIASFPQAIEVTVADSCGDPLNDGSVVATFSNGDPPLSLIPIGGGRWAATWLPGRQGGEVRVIATAESADRSLRGATQAGGSVAANASGPVVAPGSVLNGASFVARGPVTPGGIVSIFGERLSESEAVSGVPRVTELNQTVVALGAFALPLLYVNPNQINAIVPYGIAVNATQQLVIQNAGKLAVPLTVPVAAAQPAVFSADQSGQGQGLIFKSGVTLADRAHPVSAGDVIVIYCAGLGEVDPAVPAGFATPDSPLSRTRNPVSVRIGGREAKVSFAGLTPRYTGLYQVNAEVPADAPPGEAVELVLSVAGQSSPPVTLAIQ